MALADLCWRDLAGLSTSSFVSAFSLGIVCGARSFLSASDMDRIGWVRLARMSRDRPSTLGANTAPSVTNCPSHQSKSVFCAYALTVSLPPVIWRTSISAQVSRVLPFALATHRSRRPHRASGEKPNARQRSQPVSLSPAPPAPPYHSGEMANSNPYLSQIRSYH